MTKKCRRARGICRVLLCVLAMGLVLGCSAAKAETAYSVSVPNATINLPRIFEMYSGVLDVNGDGKPDSVFYDEYGVEDYGYIQFIPQGEEASDITGDHYAYSSSYIHLFPFKQFEDTLQIEPGLYWFDMEPHALSFLNGDDGRLYACAAYWVKGANGWPEEFLEFFQKRDDSYELEAIPTDYKRFVILTSRSSAYHGVYLRDYVATVNCEYVKELGRWCLVLGQVDAYAATSEARVRLKTCLTMNQGELILIARFLDGELVEGPYELPAGSGTAASPAVPMPVPLPVLEEVTEAEPEQTGLWGYQSSYGLPQCRTASFSLPQNIAVYSGPGYSYLRGAKGKASVGTGDWVGCYGACDGWYLIEYQVNGSKNRRGFIAANDISGAYSLNETDLPDLSISIVLTAGISLTDDPGHSKETLSTVPSGTEVIVKHFDGNWAFVEATTSSGLVCGYVPIDDLAN